MSDVEYAKQVDGLETRTAIMTCLIKANIDCQTIWDRSHLDMPGQFVDLPGTEAVLLSNAVLPSERSSVDQLDQLDQLGQVAELTS